MRRKIEFVADVKSRLAPGVKVLKMTNCGLRNLPRFVEGTGAQSSSSR